MEENNIEKKHDEIDRKEENICETCGDDLDKKWEHPTQEEIKLNLLKIVMGSSFVSYVLDDSQ
jgi:hypothetical protein